MTKYSEGRWSKQEMVQYRNAMAWIEKEGLMYAYKKFLDENYRTPMILLPGLFTAQYTAVGSPYRKEA